MGGTRSSSKEGGVSIVIFALSLVALLAVAALVIDGGGLYSQRRESQNAADAGSMAGARALDRWLFPSTTSQPLPSGCTASGSSGPAIVSAAARCGAEANGAEANTCEIVDADGDVIALCSSSDWVGDSDVRGVKVVATETRDALFASGSNSARTTAIATIQVIATGQAPWAICSSGISYSFFEPDGITLDEDALIAAGRFPIQGPSLYDSDDPCAAKPEDRPGPGPGSFKGNISTDANLTIGEETTVPSDPGNDVPRDWRDFLLTCPNSSTETDCMLLPVADTVDGVGGNAVVHVVAWAFFHIDVTNESGYKAFATYAGAWTGTLPPGFGTGGNLTPSATSARTVNLIL